MSNPIRRHAAAEAGLERIKKLERLLAASPANSPQRRDLTQMIRIEATAYRKSLDADQAHRLMARSRALRTASAATASTSRTTP